MGMVSIYAHTRLTVASVQLPQKFIERTRDRPGTSERASERATCLASGRPATTLSTWDNFLSISVPHSSTERASERAYEDDPTRLRDTLSGLLPLPFRPTFLTSSKMQNKLRKLVTKARTKGVRNVTLLGGRQSSTASWRARFNHAICLHASIMLLAFLIPTPTDRPTDRQGSRP